MDALEAAQRWTATWSEAWPRRDADAISALYAEDAVIRTHPFRDPLHGPAGIRDYLSWAFAAEREVHCWFSEPVTDGHRAVVEYWATLLSDGQPVTITGVASLELEPDGRVAGQHDIWVAQSGHAPPPPQWRPSVEAQLSPSDQSSGQG